MNVGRGQDQPGGVQGSHAGLVGGADQAGGLGQALVQDEQLVGEGVGVALRRDVQEARTELGAQPGFMRFDSGADRGGAIGIGGQGVAKQAAAFEMPVSQSPKRTKICKT